MKPSMICGVVGMMIAGASQAQKPVGTPVPQEKKICISEAATGSMFSKRVCHSKTEWATIKAGEDQNNTNFRDKSQLNAGGTRPQ